MASLGVATWRRRRRRIKDTWLGSTTRERDLGVAADHKMTNSDQQCDAAAKEAEPAPKHL